MRSPELYLRSYAHKDGDILLTPDVIPPKQVGGAKQNLRNIFKLLQATSRAKASGQIPGKSKGLALCNTGWPRKRLCNTG